MKRFVVLYNSDDNVRGGCSQDAIAARDNLEALEPLRAAISPLGPVELLATSDGDPARLSAELTALRPRVVFNLVEAARGAPELEACVAGLLDLLGLAYTGNTPQTLALCLDKPKTKALLSGFGLPVLDGIVISDAVRDSLAEVEYPAIVKPACMDASHGIEPLNVVWDERAARAKAAELIARFPPAVLVERFIDGREINATVVQLGGDGPATVLPLAEIEWSLAPGVPRVCGFEAKWLAASEAFRRTPVSCPAALSPPLEQRLREVALQAFNAVSGRDYARVDLRLDADQRPYVLEVNPNPCIAPTAGVARAAKAAGWSYDDFIRRIVRNAEERGPVAPLALAP